MLKISKPNAYRLIQQGEIPSVKIRRSVRVREEDSEEFVLAYAIRGYTSSNFRSQM